MYKVSVYLAFDYGWMCDSVMAIKPEVGMGFSDGDVYGTIASVSYDAQSNTFTIFLNV